MQYNLVKAVMNRCVSDEDYASRCRAGRLVSKLHFYRSLASFRQCLKLHKDVRRGRSPWRMSFICDKLIELLNFVVSFVKTMFSVDALENGGRTQDNRGPGARGSAAPRANNVHTLFDNNALAETEGHGVVHLINSNFAWQTKVNEAKTTRKVMAVDFFATWCTPCKMIAPVFVELSRKIGQQLMFAKVDIDEVPDVAAEYGVVSMPTFLFIRDGQEIDRIVGADRKELQRKCTQYANR